MDALFADALHLLRDAWLNAAILAAFVTVIAYIHTPRLKTLVFSLPVPFTCAYLASGIPVNATHISGLVLVTLYHWIVYAIVGRRGLPLGVGIAVGIGLYVGAAAMLRPLATALPFLPAAAVALGLWIVVIGFYRPRAEPGHRSAAPWWLKMPLIFVIALAIFGLTGVLAGAVTTFPYAGVFTSYEMRHSLRTLAGQYTINNISFFLLFVTIWTLEQLGIGQPWLLLAGWAVLLGTLGLVYGFGLGRPTTTLVPAGE